MEVMADIIGLATAEDHAVGGAWSDRALASAEATPLTRHGARLASRYLPGMDRRADEPSEPKRLPALT